MQLALFTFAVSVRRQFIVLASYGFIEKGIGLGYSWKEPEGVLGVGPRSETGAEPNNNAGVLSCLTFHNVLCNYLIISLITLQ